MSYTDYLNRMKINTPKILNTQMRMPDASSFTWRTKLAATSVNRRTDHVINNSQDIPAPRLFSPAVMGYGGSGFGGKVQDASSYTMSLGATALRYDNFSRGQIKSETINSSGRCLASTPASQVVSERGNADGDVLGLNMGYMRQRIGSLVIDNVGLCTSEFRPQTKSQFVETIPDLKTRKIGVGVRDPGDGLGRQVVQNTINCETTNTSGDIKGQIKSHQPFNSYSALPNNTPGSPRNLVHRSFITGIQGPQVGGYQHAGHRADKVGTALERPRGGINHRGWASPRRNPYPYMGVNGIQPSAPAQKKINEPNHYKV
jgi:hypothetical protein